MAGHSGSILLVSFMRTNTGEDSYISDANRSPLFDLVFTPQREEVKPKGIRGKAADGIRTGTWPTSLSTATVTWFGPFSKHRVLLGRS